MFYLLSSNKPERDNNTYTVGCELLKKVDLILNDQSSNISVSNSNVLKNTINNDIFKIKVK